MVPFQSRFSPGWRLRQESPTALLPLCRRFCRYLMPVRLVKAHRSLPHCFGWIQCSTNSATTRVSRNWLPPPRQNRVRRVRLQQAPASDTDAPTVGADKLTAQICSFELRNSNRPLVTRSRCVRKAKLVCAKNAEWLLFNPNHLQKFAQ